MNLHNSKLVKVDQRARFKFRQTALQFVSAWRVIVKDESCVSYLLSFVT